MQLFSADATMFSNVFIFFFDHKKLKKPPSKVAHNRPKPFFPQPSPTHSQQPKIDFLYHKNVPPSVCSLVCACAALAATKQEVGTGKTRFKRIITASNHDLSLIHSIKPVEYA